MYLHLKAYFSLDRDFIFSLASGITGMKKATLTANSARRHKDVSYSYRTGPFPAFFMK